MINSKRKYSQKITLLPTLIRSLALLSILVGSSLVYAVNVKAADIAGFDAGNIISDSVFYNPNTMSVTDIQNFLNSKVTTCDTNHAAVTGSTGTVYNPKWICLKDYYENPSSPYTVSFTYTDINGNPQTDGRTFYENNYYRYTALSPVYVNGDYRQGLNYLKGTITSMNGSIPPGAISAAQIIYNVARDTGVNPQVLIVLLQKEQGMITDTWPGPWQYQSATGYGCPDYRPCSAGYAGFSKQLSSAARQFKNYQATPTNYNYIAGRNNTVLWNPNAACGTSTLYIQNQATAGLYNYTPYRPNAAALASGYGTGDSCSSYGNRNFWLYFTDWFGSTQVPSVCSGNETPLSYINRYYNARTYMHFYSAYDCDTTFLKSIGYVKEGAVFNTSPCTAGYATPIYRYYNPKSGLHMWSADNETQEQLDAGKSGYRVEAGVVFCVAKGGMQNVHPVYRFYNPKTYVHIWVTEPTTAELDILMNKAGYTQNEGAVFYTQ